MGQPHEIAAGRSLREARPHGLHLGGEPGKLLEVHRRETGEAASSGGGEVHPHDAVIGGVGLATNEARPLSAVDELDRGVMTEQEVVGKVADGGITVVPPNGKQQLVLCRGETSGLGLLLAPVEEPP